MKILPWDLARDQYGAKWALLIGALGLNPSLHPDWMDAALRSHGLTNDTLVGVVKDRDELVAVLPVTLRRSRINGVLVRCADLASNTVSYHSQLIARQPSSQLLDRVLDGALAGRWDVLRAYNVPDDSPTALAIQEWACGRRYRSQVMPGERSPYLPIAMDWEGFLRTRPKKFRANVTRVLRKPAEYGAAEMVWFVAGDAVDQLLQDILAIERRSWKAAEGIAIPDRPAELEYHRQVLPFLAASGSLLANILYVDGAPVAYVLCCLADGWAGQLKTSFCEGVKDVGACVVTASVQRAFELGAREYDFLGAADPHKLKWTDHVRPHSSHVVFSHGWRGRSAGMLGRIAASVRPIVGRGGGAPAR